MTFSQNMMWPFLRLEYILLSLVVIVSTFIETVVILYFYDLGVAREVMPFAIILANAITAILGYTIKVING